MYQHLQLRGLGRSKELAAGFTFYQPWQNVPRKLASLESTAPETWAFFFFEGQSGVEKGVEKEGICSRRFLGVYMIVYIRFSAGYMQYSQKPWLVLARLSSCVHSLLPICMGAVEINWGSFISLNTLEPCITPPIESDNLARTQRNITRWIPHQRTHD